jgi:hypothetical protein
MKLSSLGAGKYYYLGRVPLLTWSLGLRACAFAGTVTA